MTATTGTTWRLELTQYTILGFDTSLAGCIVLSRMNRRSCAAFAGAVSRSIEVLTRPCYSVPWSIGTLIDSAETLLLPSRPALPAGKRKKAATILIIDIFLSLLKRFYAGFYCCKAVDSERLR
jgi:hypothetical protein